MLIFIGIILFSIFAWGQTRRLIEAEDRITQTLVTLEEEEELLGYLLETESAALMYVLAPSPQQATSYERARQILQEKLLALKPFMPQQVTHFPEIESLLAMHLKAIKEAMRLREAGKFPQAVAKLQAQQATHEKLLSLLRSSSRKLQDALVQHKETSKRLQKNTLYTLGTSLLLLMLGTATISILRDISLVTQADQRLARERDFLRHIIDAIPLQIFVKNRKKEYMIDNSAHRKFLGVSTMEELYGKTADNYLSKATADTFSKTDDRVFDEGLPMLEIEDLVTSLTGEMKWLSTTKVPLRNEEGEIIGLVGTSIDISERKKNEERLRLFASQLQASNEELREFASVASHDLQEPLRKIRAFADRLLVKYGDLLGDQGRDYLYRMLSAGHRMQALIEDILVLSRLSSAKRPFEKVDLHSVVEDVLADLDLRIEQTKARIEIGFLPIIEADSVQMHQLFQNLLSNALKFHKPDTAPEVTISAKILHMHDKLISGAAPGDDVCQIMVKDNGIGIEEQYAEQIFVLFQRLHDINFYQGTGIGLSVCRKITQRHGGSITVKSAKNEGSTFIVMLPVKQMNQPL